jgi:hypothetical protein
LDVHRGHGFYVNSPKTLRRWQSSDNPAGSADVITDHEAVHKRWTESGVFRTCPLCADAVPDVNKPEEK